MKPGLYAWASFDGAPLDRDDMKALGRTDAEAVRWQIAPGIAVCAVDDTAAGPAVSVVQTADSLTAFLGYFDEQDDLAAQLGLPRETAPADLAWAAIERFGADAPAAMLGQWSFLRWNARAKELIVLGSEAFRDPLFYACDGQRFALSPDMMRLTRLPWVGRALDPQGFALRMSRAGLRHMTGRKTVWRGIFRALPGVRDLFALGRHTEIAPAPQTAPEPWRGSFEDAVDALNTVGRRIVGQQMRRYGRSAFLLSGGLDSTLVTTLGAQERGEGAEMFCLSSVAPAGSGLQDERACSLATAARFGIPLELVVPGPEVSVFRPAPGVFNDAGEPITGQRHYLYEMLFRAAATAGAHAIFDGQFGELSITTPPRFGALVSWPRHLLYSLRERRQQQAAAEDWQHEAFHVKFAKEFLAALPPEWESAWHQGPERPRRSQGGLIGFDSSTKKVAAAGTLVRPGLRSVVPYLDPRLLRLAARLPQRFLVHRGETRALGRSMLRGHIPEAVRTRTAKMPFSPDFEQRAHRQATEALSQIAIYRASGLEKWLDLDLLAVELGHLQQGKSLSADTKKQPQMTCLAAEFLMWVADGNSI